MKADTKQGFEAWWADKQRHITATLRLLNAELSDDAEQILRETAGVEKYLGYMYVLLAAADSYLDQHESQALDTLIRAHGAKIPAYEKEVRVKAAVCPVREARDTIRGVIEAIQRRVSLAQSWVSYVKGLPKI